MRESNPSSSTATGNTVFRQRNGRSALQSAGQSEIAHGMRNGITGSISRRKRNAKSDQPNPQT